MVDESDISGFINNTNLNKKIKTLATKTESKHLTQAFLLVKIIGIGFDSCSLFSNLDFHLGKNVVTFGIDNNPSMHNDNKKKDILVLTTVQHKDYMIPDNSRK